MSRLLVFLEAEEGEGSSRAAVDVANALEGFFDDACLAVPEDALSRADLSRLSPRVRVAKRPVAASRRIGSAARARPSLVREALRWGAAVAKPLLDRQTERGVERLLDEERPDLVVAVAGHPTGPALLGLGRHAAHRALPTVLHLTAPPPSNGSGPNRALKAHPWAAARLVLVPAAFLAHDAQVAWDLPADRIRVIVPGLPDRRWAAGAGATPGPVRIGYASPLDRSKGCLDLVEAFHRARTRGSNAHLVLAGAGDAAALVAAHVHALGLDAAVEVRDPVAGDLHPFLSGLNVFALPTREAGFPFELLAAMRAGCAIVAARTGPVPEMVTEGDEALLFPAGDVNALSEALHLLASDARLRERIGTAARARFERQFTAEAAQERIERAFSEANLLPARASKFDQQR